MAMLSTITNAIAARKLLWLTITLGFVVIYYFGLVLSVVIRFGDLPNYATVHDYIRNVAVIVRSTPSIADMLPIIFDEWLLEVGYMNRNYGRGVSEWSVQIIPAKLAVVLAIGALVATNILLLKQLPRACARATPYSGLAATGLGAALVGFTSVTLTWVVCCAAPSWAVGLAMLGVSVATAFGVQPYGPVITLAGFLALFGATYLLARDAPRTSGPGVVMPRLAQTQCLVKPNRVRTSDAEEYRKARRNRGAEAAEERVRSNKGHIVIDEVGVTFGRGAQRSAAVERTSLEIKPGEFVCLLGPSGCGKSTLLNCVAGYVQATEGSVTVDGVAIDRPGPDRGMVFQQYSLFPWMTIRQNIGFGPRVTGGGSVNATADTFLGLIGLSRFADRYPGELSGGMQQRVGIARALANYPSVLLMDEPFGALDSQTRLMMQESLLQIWSEFGITVLFVTHDVDEALFLADRVLIMSASPGKIIADLTVPIARPRTLDIATDADFIQLKRQCLEKIRAESIKAFDQQFH